MYCSVIPAEKGMAASAVLDAAEVAEHHVAEITADSVAPAEESEA